MQRRNNLKDESGFTLIEITVTLVIMALVLTVAGTVYFFGNRMYTAQEVKNSEKYIGDTVYNYMKDRLTYATAVEIIDPSYQANNTAVKPSNEKVFSFSASETGSEYGYLKHGDNSSDLSKTVLNVFGEDYYSNYTIQYQVGRVDSKVLNLTVKVFNKNQDEVYTNSSDVKVINIDNAINNGDTAGISVVNSSGTNTDGTKSSLYTNAMVSYTEAKSETKSELMQTVDTMRQHYINVYNALAQYDDLKIIIQQPDCANWENYCTSKNISDYFKTRPNNNIISGYLYQYIYNSSWPVLTQSMLSSETLNNSKYASVKAYFNQTNPSPLYFRIYSKDGSNATDNCFVFVSTTSNPASWTAYYFYLDHDNQKIYVSNKSNSYTNVMAANSVIGVANTWSNIKSSLQNSTNGFVLFE